ncbi:hypothetical protein FIV42_05525 [Persicimonas caeni]|uniref:Uncharacterized protein n=1 Tax=Persicimonas caeni TaxID=2292766 RepID=A0A4Y6PQB6_PERCE|nr:hypothetical protein [Persicimonas caeni]QDG50207.1 hypothetical protein FIV42_05525 [Persicimonas caeni]QED31428.1 hypothetical protein FRD00_05520 [Persicimonas caeni]
MAEMDDGKGLIRKVFRQRAEVVKIVLVAVLLSIGVNLIAQFTWDWAKPHKQAMLVVGLFLCVLAVAILAVNLFSKITKVRSVFEGIFVYDEKSDAFVSVDRYWFSHEICRYYDAAIAEDLALKARWENCRFELFGKRNDMFVELATYALLNQLSVHLSDYFNDTSFEDESLEVFQRDDLTKDVLKNEFLALFSKPMEKRAPFVKQTLAEKDTGPGEVIASFSDGAIYEKFRLVLPKGSRLTLRDDGAICVKTRRLDLVLGVRFIGTQSLLPSEFQRLYLGVEQPIHHSVYEVDVSIEASFRLLPLLAKKGWRYYFWLESFFEDIRSKVSREHFLKSIGWQTAYTTYRLMNPETRNDQRESCTSDQEEKPGKAETDTSTGSDIDSAERKRSPDSNDGCE